MVKRSESKRSLLQVREVELHELQLRQQGLVLRLVGEPLESALHARLDLRARQAFDAGEQRGQLRELARARAVADLGEIGRAAWRERGEISVGAGSLKKKK